jgi:hypothetical protein
MIVYLDKEQKHVRLQLRGAELLEQLNKVVQDLTYAHSPYPCLMSHVPCPISTHLLLPLYRIICTLLI